MQTPRRATTLLLGLGLTAAMAMLAGVVGCEKGGTAAEGYDAKIEGTISLDGKPLDMGMVFFEKDGKSASSTIAEGGKLMDDGGVPSGKVKAKVSADMYAFMAGRVQAKSKPGEKAKGGGGPGGPPGEYRPIPKKYNDFNTSKLEFDLKPGVNTINIELTTK